MRRIYSWWLMRKYRLRERALVWRNVDYWDEAHEVYYVYETDVQRMLWRISLNDFPDEPLYSLFVEGNRMYFDEWPDHWERPDSALESGT